MVSRTIPFKMAKRGPNIENKLCYGPLEWKSQGKTKIVTPNILERDFTAAKPNEK